MAISSSNSPKVNSLAELITLRFAENAGYLTVGSRKYFKNQIEGKRNGQTYRFVIRDVGEVVNSLVADPTTQKTSVVEREVALSLDPWDLMIQTNSVEEVTDFDMDREIAEPNAKKLVSDIVKKAISKDIGKVSTAFFGQGFGPLALASAHLKDISTEDIYGFIDSGIQAILTSNGQQFNPVGSPNEFYKKGLLGEFQGAEYRTQRFLPKVKISSTLATQLASATVTSLAANASDDTKMVLTIGATSLTEKIPAGTPIFIEDVYACDLIGVPTTNLKAFVVLEDATPSSNAAALSVEAVDYSGLGTREIAKADGSNWTLAGLANQAISSLAEGTYFMGILRLDGAYEFETLNKLPAKGADYQKVDVEGITMHRNTLVDILKMTNQQRMDIVCLNGVVESRGVVLVYCKR